jgi:CheY-like chemotaxis protein
MTRILSVDDEREMLDLLRLILERAGYEFTGVVSGVEALAVMRTETIDLLTQDFMRLDNLDGRELLREMKSDVSLCSIPVLGVSAGPRELREERFEPFGLDFQRDLDGYVKKPYAPQELLEAVEEALRRHGKPIPDREKESRERETRR